MGIFKSIGKGIGKATFGSFSRLGGFAMDKAESLGSYTLKRFSSAPIQVGLAIGGTALAMKGMADLTGEDSKEAAKIGAGVGFLTSMVPGGAATLTSVGGYLGAAAIGNTATAGLAAANLASHMVKMPELAAGETLKLTDLSKVKMTGLGKTVMGAALLAHGIADADRKFTQIHMGINDGRFRTATPDIPVMNPITSSGNIDYSNTGATGDLVFALHNNR